MLTPATPTTSGLAHKIYGLRDEALLAISPCPPYASILITGATECLHHIADALETYSLTPDTDRLHRDIISACMDFLQIWESWIDRTNSRNFKYSASKVFHCILLRHAKGIIKAYRIWKIDCQKDSTPV